ncbi:ARC1 protein [Coccidioides immitis H538.4]|uniref:ARC1 protein n=1 Tax=Coccidioides immitis H538.4 TaxID=396776 RepID=A0A0J8RHJ0_COCIT|nr:ARC1 protein [Coccidioides immitis H538.4]
MQGRKVVTVCNLKPVTMRGIKSAAMASRHRQRTMSHMLDQLNWSLLLRAPKPESAFSLKVGTMVTQRKY